MQKAQDYWWTGLYGGLGNRLIALAAARACAGEIPVRFRWSNDPSCPGEYQDVFQPGGVLIPQNAPKDGEATITSGWEPFGVYEAFAAAIGPRMSRAAFSTRLVQELRLLPFQAELRDEASKRLPASKRHVVGVHLRRTDRIALHRDQFRAFLAGRQGLNRELPAYLSAMYGLLPLAVIREYENRMIGHALRREQRRRPDLVCMIFSDNSSERENLARYLAASGLSLIEYAPAAAQRMTKPGELRETDIKAAVIDLLVLSRCDVVAQGNRASTFSIAASIIGAKPIITPPPMYPFWRMIAADTGATPNDPRLGAVTAPAG